MSSDLGITPGLAEQVDLSDVMKRARQERGRVIAELFGFGFAAAKDVVGKAAQSVASIDPATRAPLGGR